MSEQPVLIFANGELQKPEWIQRLAETACMIIAADGGLQHVQDLGLVPDILIGDLDSVTPEQVQWAEENGVEIRRFPADKDETDLELALIAAAATGNRKMVIVGALGGRLDQTLSNVLLLHLPVLTNLDVRIDDGLQEVILVRNALELAGKPGDLVSLLPLSPIVRGITTSGLKYPLNDESMIFFHSRGLSNRMLTDTALIEFQSGVLICIHERQENLQ